MHKAEITTETGNDTKWCQNYTTKGNEIRKYKSKHFGNYFAREKFVFMKVYECPVGE